jgi:peptidoglycan/xylan/chitin deacetylase (PgdA/CDA1 family)
MTAAFPDLVVRRGDIESAPPRVGGGFEQLRAFPVKPPRLLTRSLGIFCVNTVDRVVALTYDDGPAPLNTPRILDVLARHQATATFFVLGSQVASHPELARRIVEGGHQVGLHGEDHRSLFSMSTKSALAQLRDARRRVEDVVGVAVNLYRPPYGDITLRQAEGIRRMGLQVVIWSGDPMDWRDGDLHTVTSRAIGALFPGAILLLHDHLGDAEDNPPGEAVQRLDRAALTESILRSLSAQQFRTTTVGSLVAEHQQVKSLIRRVRAGS